MCMGLDQPLGGRQHRELTVDDARAKEDVNRLVRRQPYARAPVVAVVATATTTGAATNGEADQPARTAGSDDVPS